MKKSILMLMALFVLGACSSVSNETNTKPDVETETKPDIEPEPEVDYETEFLNKIQSKDVAMTEGSSLKNFYFSADGKSLHTIYYYGRKVGTFLEASDENTATYIDDDSRLITVYTKDGTTGYMEGDILIDCLYLDDKLNIFLNLNYEIAFLGKVQNKEVAMTDGGSVLYYFSSTGKYIYISDLNIKAATFEEASDENTATYSTDYQTITIYTEDGVTGYMKGYPSTTSVDNVFFKER